MRPLALAVLAASLHAQPAAVEADLALRLRAAFERIAHPATRAQADLARGAVRAKLKHAIGFHRVSQAVRATLFASPPSDHPPPLLVLLVLDCLSEAPAYAQRGFLTACFNLKQDPDLLAGITAQGRIQHDVARVLEITGVDRSRIILVGEGPSATLAAGLFPQFTQVAIDAPGIENEPIFGVAHIADTWDVLALAAPRPMLVNNAGTRLTDPLRDHYRLYDSGDKLFLDLAPLRWLAQDVPAASTPQPQDIELPAEPATPDPPRSLPEVTGSTLPAARLTMGLQIALSQEIKFETQPGIQIPATVYRTGPIGGDYANGTLIAFSDDGRADLANDEIVKLAHLKNWDVFAVDPRGLGQMKLTAGQAAHFQLGEYFPWQQATDIARIRDFLGRSEYRSAIYAKGPQSSLIAALLTGTRAEWILLRAPAPSLAVNPPFYPGFDLPTLLRDPKFVIEPRFE